MSNTKLPVMSSFDPMLTMEQFNSIYDLVESNVDTKALNSLFSKSVSAGVSFEIVSEVYKRGTLQEHSSKTPQQLGFERVNSFLSGGKAFELDSDLSEGLKNPKDNPCWKGYKPVGTKMKNGKEVPNCVPEENTNTKFNDFIAELSPQLKTKYTGAALKSMHDPKEGESQEDYMKRYAKRLKGVKQALKSTNPSQRFAKEEYGAGFEGTDELVKKYKKDTPGQNENFMDGKNPQDKGDMARHGLKGKTKEQLRKVRSSDTASPRAKQLAHWFLNMHKDKK